MESLSLWSAPLLHGGGQCLVVGVNHEHRKQLCGLGLARITAHTVKGARPFEPTVTGTIDPLEAETTLA
jgi:hypothetical protein